MKIVKCTIKLLLIHYLKISRLSQKNKKARNKVQALIFLCCMLYT